MKKWIYVAFVGGLTATAVSACYWQTNRYIGADLKWKKIREQLNKELPQDLNSINSMQELYAFKYMSVHGKLADQFERIQRIKKGRMGYLVVRALKYKNKEGEDMQVAALQGWCQGNFEYKPQISGDKSVLIRGIIRQKEKKDYVHDKFKKQDLQRFKMNTYINLEEIVQKLNIKSNDINQNFYFEIFRPLDSTQHDPYPYQYSVDNFQLPYLTPDKHLSYATFWGFCAIVGLTAIRKVLKFK